MIVVWAKKASYREVNYKARKKDGGVEAFYYFRYAGCMERLTIRQLHKQLLDKKISCKEVVQGFLDVIRKKDKDIHAYLEVDEDGAMKQAENVDAKIVSLREIFGGETKGGALPTLAGVPFAIKDNILVEGFYCTAGSKILENYKAPYEATVIRKLRDAGAIFLGKTNLDEFAMGSSTENSAFGPTRNPLDLKRVPGGSSGGSAAAVAAGMCMAALGSDTGGSIRQPAAFCGTVGFKPTYGAVSRYGLIAMASSFDQIGPITRSVEDARVIFDVIQGKDRFDSTSLDVNSKFSPFEGSPAGREARNSKQIQNLRIGIPKEYFGEGIDDAVKKAVEGAITKYEENGAKVEEISLPHTAYGLAVYYIIMPSEVSANLSRYDGIRYGLSHGADDLLNAYLKTRQVGLGGEVRRRIMLGTYALSSGYYDAYYVRAQKVRALIKQDFDNAFSKIDVIMTPATPTPPFLFGEKTKNPVSMYLSDICTVGANLAGLPAISIPCAWVEKEGVKLPVGLQIMGPQRQDYRVLEVAQMYEKF